jgi:hypothetical protein
MAVVMLKVGPRKGEGEEGEEDIKLDYMCPVA